MNKKMFLASSFSNVFALLPDFEQNLAGKTVTFIPTASKAELIGFLVGLEKIAFKKLGLIIDELNISKSSTKEIRTKINNNDLIYVCGGNTFYLLQELKNTGADQIIIDAVNSEKLYIGESAGSVITAPNIEYISLMDSVKKAPKLTNCNALNLIDIYPLPHYESIPFKKVTKNIVNEYSSKINLRTITNHQVILVEGNQFTIQSVK